MQNSRPDICDFKDRRCTQAGGQHELQPEKHQVSLYVRVNRFRVLIESRERCECSDITIGVVTLCDLAGSENEKIAGESARLQEAKFINKVLVM